ncbi:MAG: dUTP diphosphatase [Pseudomonadota bacterium]|nr:dUTP diphosphatase [Pseudomonadota bacterium]
MARIETKIVNKLIGKRFPLPTYTTSGAAGLDLRACIETPLSVAAGETRLIGSGIAINILDPHLMGVLVPHSGLGIHHGIVLANLVGIIDSDFHGEIQMGIWNRSQHPFKIEPGDRLCQMIFVPIVQVELEAVDSFTQTTQRGEGGFGHTGRQ